MNRIIIHVGVLGVVSLFHMAVVASESRIYYWKNDTSQFYSFGDPNSWVMGTSGGGDPATDAPGENDWLHYTTGYSTTQCFDLDGMAYIVKGVSFQDWVEQYGKRTMRFSNGTLTFTDDFYNRQVVATIKSGARFILAPSCNTRFGWSGARCQYMVEEGGRLDVGGSVSIGCLQLTNAGQVDFDPTALYLWEETHPTTPSWFDNSGTMNFPNGLAFTPTEKRTEKVANETQILQKSGRMTFGGPVTVASGCYGSFSFILSGGTLAIGAGISLSMSDFTLVGMPTTGTSAAIEISSDAVLDWSNAIFADDTSLTVTGGTMIFGGSAPAALTLSAGTKICFADSGISLTSVSGAEDATFSVADSVVVEGVKLVLSDDSELLTVIAGKLQLPTGWMAQVSNGAIILKRTSFDRPCFISVGEAKLSADCWQGPTLTENAAVYVSGDETIAILDHDAPTLSKITVRNGATLKIAEAIDVMPELEVSLDAKIVIPEGVTITLPPIAGIATSTQLPVVEIATGAVVSVGADYEFKNVRLDLFGELRPTGDVWFGTAEPSETTYFGLRWIGGTLNYSGNGTMSIACPKAQGGRVVCPDGILLRDTDYLPLYSNYYSFNVGYLNPSDEPFDMCIDRCYLDLRGNRAMYFGGAVAVKCINGGGLCKPESWTGWGLYGRVFFQDCATLDLDGESYVYYVYNQRHTFSFETSMKGCEQLVVKNGSYFAVHTPTGNSSASVRVEDGYYDVLELQVDDDDVPHRDWISDAFSGFASINIPRDKFLCIRSSEAYVRGAEWDRELAIGAPIAGEGSLVVSNATSLADALARLDRRYGSKAPQYYPSARGYGMRAIVKLGTNTATGEARAVKCEQNCQLVFADGSNWAGTLVADENIAFTNLTTGGAATATFGTLKLSGKFPIKVWKRDGAVTSDAFVVTTAVVNSPNGQLTPQPQGDYRPRAGDSFDIGSIPATAELPLVKRNWRLTTGDVVDGRRPLKLVYDPVGLVLTVR